MNIKPYFWDLSEAALAETEKILHDSTHPKFSRRMVTLLSRCDKPKDVFSLVTKEQFAEVWPNIRKEWKRTNQAPDFRDWWETVYEQILSRDSPKLPEETPLEELRKIGNIIHKARLEKGWTQTEFARLTKMRQPDISAIEKGRKNLTLETLVRLGRILGLEKVAISLKRLH